MYHKRLYTSILSITLSLSFGIIVSVELNNQHQRYSDYIVLEIHEGNNYKAFKEASILGLDHLRQVGSLKNYHLFKIRTPNTVSGLKGGRLNLLKKESNNGEHGNSSRVVEIAKELEKHHAIKSVLPQRYLRRSKRDGGINFIDPLYPEQWNIHGRSEKGMVIHSRIFYRRFFNHSSKNGY